MKHLLHFFLRKKFYLKPAKLPRMNRTIMWKGIYYQSLEYCEIITNDNEVQVTSVILGIHENKEYRVDYSIKTNANWELIACHITSRVSGVIDIRAFQSEIDISVSPFTNSLPINRLKLQIDQTREIKVVYIDVLNQAVKNVMQRYTRISDFQYHFENVPNDFEATITVDPQGIIRDYPGLFVRLT